MFAWTKKWWRQRQRTIDMKILWPECKKQSHDINYAKNIFFYHCVNDPAWSIDYTVEDIQEFVEQLK